MEEAHKKKKKKIIITQKKKKTNKRDAYIYIKLKRKLTKITQNTNIFFFFCIRFKTQKQNKNFI